MDEAYQIKREKVQSFFVPANRSEETLTTHDSPCDRYQLEVCNYQTKPQAMRYSQGVVTRKSDSAIIAIIQRNFGHFWHCFIQHPNGNLYLLCGEDYQGYSVINLDNQKTHVYFPPAGHQGLGFCWTSVTPSPNKLILAVAGCFWAAPYDMVFFDFRDPEKLPLSELLRVENLEKDLGWMDNQTYEITVEVEYRVSDGMPYSKLSEEEQDEVDADSSRVGYRYEHRKIARPEFGEAD